MAFIQSRDSCLFLTLLIEYEVSSPFNYRAAGGATGAERRFGHSPQNGIFFTSQEATQIK